MLPHRSPSDAAMKKLAITVLGLALAAMAQGGGAPLERAKAIEDYEGDLKTAAAEYRKVLATEDAAAMHGEAALRLGRLLWRLEQKDEGKQWLERALMVETDLPGTLRARALIGLAHMNYFQGVETGGIVAEALLLGRDTGDSWVVCVALFLRGLAALERGDRDEALACALEAREAASAGGGAVEHGGPLFILADSAVSSGDYERAQRLYDESIEVHRQAAESWGLGIQLVAAAAMRLVREEHRQARGQVLEALSLFQELEDSRGIAYSLELLAGVHAAGGDHDTAARLWAAADELLKTMGAVLPPNMRLVRERYIGTVQASLGAVRFGLVRSEGRAMPIAEAITHACRPMENLGLLR